MTTVKRFLILCMFAAVSSVAFSQVDGTFQFVDANGNEVPDGSVITVNTIDEWGEMIVPLRVKNVAGSKAAASMYEDIDAKPNGDWQTCAFGNCVMLGKSGYSARTVASATFNEDIITEWIPQEGAYATWEATLQIHVFNVIPGFMGVDTPGDQVIGYGPKVTVRFIYADPAGLSEASASKASPAAVYSLGGQLRKGTELSQGVNVVRMSDGTVRKVLKH